MTTTMQAAQISTPGGEWEVVERDIPEPRAGHVRVKVEACGICHSDVFVKDGCNRSRNTTCKLSSCGMLTWFKIMVIGDLNRRRCR